MTIIAAVSTTFDTLVIADSRLSVTDERGQPLVVRDVCQKILVPNGWSLVGFAGDLCMARHLLRGIFNRLKHTAFDSSGWLQDDQTLLEFVRNGIRSHMRQRADHRPCHTKPVELLIAWMDYTHSIVAGNHKLGDDLFVPGTQIVVVRTPQMTIERTNLGLNIIGSGAAIAASMRDEAMMKIVNAFRGHPLGDQYRCFFAYMVVRDLLNDIGGVPTVGGLYQMANLNRKGVEIIPYMCWMPVEQGYGTYVAMRMEDGCWIQEHRPTQTKIRIILPFDIHLRGPRWRTGQHEMFDPARTLTRCSSGVVSATNPQLLFAPYDPDRVHDAIRASWGDNPLPPLTFAGEKPPT